MPTSTTGRIVTTDAAIDAAIERGRLVPSHRVVAAAYDEAADEVALRFESGTRLYIPRTLLEGLANATPAALAQIEIEGPGTALVWPQLDVAHHVPGLIGGVFGTRKWMRELGRRGGQARTPEKAAAARANGRKGGRPRKNP
jgi:Protein of unknown function (DUF2442)